MDISRATLAVPEEGRTHVAYRPGWRIWRRFVAIWDLLALPATVRLTVDVGDDRVARCHSLYVEAKDNGETLTVGHDDGTLETIVSDGEVTGALLRRLPVARMLDDAVAIAVMREGEAGSEKDRLFYDAAEFRAYRRKYPGGRSRERWMLTADHLREVAKVYRSNPGREVIAVAEHWQKPRSTASRWIARAKAENHLGVTEP
jgi:hypothetical protein